jgi:hypothetical protein
VRVRIGQPLFQADHLLLALARLAVGVGEERVRLLARFELGFFFQGIGFALGLLPHLPDVLFGAANGFCGETLAAAVPTRRSRRL